MAKAHIVEVVTSFAHSVEVGALISVSASNGEKREIAPARTITTAYAAGQRLKFSAKPAASAFVEFHGAKVRYIGRE
jgi:hypothetical protein